MKGVLVPVDLLSAEDHFVKAMDKSDKAMFFAAQIYSKGLCKSEDGDSVFDIDEALSLYRTLSESKSRYSAPSLLLYCELLLSEGKISDENKVGVFGHISQLINDNVPGSVKLYGEFLIKELEWVSKSHTTPSKLTSFSGKRESELILRKLNNSINVVKECFQ